eukprot:scaffold201947_cov30-Tisochrysis_lutea.AAC.2
MERATLPSSLAPAHHAAPADHMMADAAQPQRPHAGTTTVQVAARYRTPRAQRSMQPTINIHTTQHSLVTEAQPRSRHHTQEHEKK